MSDPFFSLTQLFSLHCTESLFHSHALLLCKPNKKGLEGHQYWLHTIIFITRSGAVPRAGRQAKGRGRDWSQLWRLNWRCEEHQDGSLPERVVDQAPTLARCLSPARGCLAWQHVWHLSPVFMGQVRLPRVSVAVRPLVSSSQEEVLLSQLLVWVMAVGGSPGP